MAATVSPETGVFGTQNMAEGYAKFRPPIHGLILNLANSRLRLNETFGVTLDVGCGSGISTIPLRNLSRHVVGIEPAEDMVHWAKRTTPEISFVVGNAEAIPLRNNSVDLITAAGSLNYARLSEFFAEAQRVLAPKGAVVVYDFSPGKTIAGTTALDDWFGAFIDRYPWPVAAAQELNPSILAKMPTGLNPIAHDHFEIPIAYGLQSYIDYMLTETNVAQAIQWGAAMAEIQSWIHDALLPIWGAGTHEVMFKGYWACLSK